MTVSHVSKFLRHVSLHQKSLWTTLDLAWSMQHWKMWAERAGGKLLYCVLSSPINSRPKIQSQLEHHSARICSMKLDVSREDIEDAEFVGNATHFPALTSLI